MPLSFAASSLPTGDPGCELPARLRKRGAQDRLNLQRERPVEILVAHRSPHGRHQRLVGGEIVELDLDLPARLALGAHDGDGAHRFTEVARVVELRAQIAAGGGRRDLDVDPELVEVGAQGVGEPLRIERRRRRHHDAVGELGVQHGEQRRDSHPRSQHTRHFTHDRPALTQDMRETCAKRYTIDELCQRRQ